MDNNNNERFPLDEAGIQAIAELREQAKAAQIAMNAILGYFARQHELSGRLTLAENGRELILEAAPKSTETRE